MGFCSATLIYDCIFAEMSTPKRGKQIILVVVITEQMAKVEKLQTCDLTCKKIETWTFLFALLLFIKHIGRLYSSKRNLNVKSNLGENILTKQAI